MVDVVTEGPGAAPPARSTAAETPAEEAPAVAPPPVFPESMVTIPGGTFTMGCPAAADSTCGSDEKPRHRVRLSPYEIDVDEVTVGRYRACMDAGVCGLLAKTLLEQLAPRSRALVPCREQFRVEHSNRPMVCVSMPEAGKYCEWRGKRLPTEAEWERAARGDDTTPDKGGRLYPWGDEPADSDRACAGTKDLCDVGAHPKGASPFGLHDMAGNAAEWVLDFYDATFYASSPKQDPDGSWELLPAQRQACMSPTCWTARGGSFADEPQALRSTARTPKSADDYPQFGVYGFRCARSTEASRREYFANRVNLWNAKRIKESKTPRWPGSSGAAPKRAP